MNITMRLLLGLLTIAMMQIILRSDNDIIICITLVVYACVFYIRGLYDR